MSSPLEGAAAKKLRRQLDRPPVVDRRAGARAAAAAQGGSSWVASMLRAIVGPGKLTVDEYFYYGLHGVSPEVAATFVGKRKQNRLHHKCNDAKWFAVAHDKILFYTVMRGAGLPIPETVALYSPAGRAFDGALLRSEDELRGFLSNGSAYPLFAKPVDGMYSVGALQIEDLADGALTLKGQGSASVDEAVAFMREVSDDGYLFQRVMRPSAASREAFGDALSSVRLLVLWEADGLAIESAVVKIPRAGSVADNYWRGNMLGAIDRDSGEIYRVVSGVGQGLVEVDRHPDTGAPLRGLRLPGWEDVTRLCLQAAGALPGIRTQSWDVAMTGAGPVLLEVNFGGDLNLHQLAHGRGALTPRYVSHLRRCGYKGSLP